jgi:hypothetical protein
MPTFLALLSSGLLGYAGYYLTGNYTMTALISFGVLAFYLALLQLFNQLNTNMVTMYKLITANCQK